MSPDDPFDEATADMISDGAIDLRNGVLKFYFLKDEAEKVPVLWFLNGCSILVLIAIRFENYDNKIPNY